jgi:transcriptional regulator with XRE-family HTH domain
VEAVDAEPAALRIDEMRRAGKSLREIARLTGVGHTTITNVARRTTTEIWPDTFSRILSVGSSDASDMERRAG